MIFADFASALDISLMFIVIKLLVNISLEEHLIVRNTLNNELIVCTFWKVQSAKLIVCKNE